MILINNLLNKHLYIQYTREKLQMAGLMSADQNFIPLSAPTLLTLFFVQYCITYAIYVPQERGISTLIKPCHGMNQHMRKWIVSCIIGGALYLP